MKYLLLREAGGLGDVVRMFSVARGLHSIDTEVHLATLGEYLSIVDQCPYVDKFIPLMHRGDRRNRRTPWTDSKVTYLNHIREMDYDRVIDLFCPGWRYETNVKGDLEHDRIDCFCMEAGVEPVAPVLEPPPDVDCSRAKEWLKIKSLTERTVCISRKSTDVTRTLPIETAYYLADILKADGYSPFFLDNDLRPYSRKDYFPVYRAKDFKALLAMVSVVPHFITVDNGILHLAAAYQKPTVAIFSASSRIVTKHYETCMPFVATGYDTGGFYTRCKQPCDYRLHRGFNRDTCRSEGCYWMNRVSPEKVVELFKTVVREFASC